MSGSKDSNFSSSISEWGLERTQVGLPLPPIQFYTLQNLGLVSIDYRLDLTEVIEGTCNYNSKLTDQVSLQVEELNSQTYDFPVVTCLDNTSGRLEPGESSVIRWIFNPLEAKRHSWTVLIVVEGGDSRAVRFIADGVAPSPHDLCPPPAWPLPPYQRVPVPSQVVWIAQERFALADVPVGALVRRMLFLSNYDAEQTMAFSFEANKGSTADMIKFQPSSGQIPPGGHAVVRLTVRSMSPAVFDIDMRCSIEMVIPEEEEEEDLGDEGVGSPLAGTRVSLSRTGGRGTPAGSSGGARPGRKPRRTSIVEMAPPYRGTKAPDGKGPTVTFTERSVTADGVSRRKSQVSAALDDVASVRSGFSGMTSASRASAPVSRASAATGMTTGQGSSGSSAGMEDMVYDVSLFISVQVYQHLLIFSIHPVPSQPLLNVCYLTGCC